MTARLSTGLVNDMLDTSSFKAALEGASGMLLKFYSGARPASANDAPTGTLLCTVSNGGAGTGVHFQAAAVANVISKAAAETWKGNCVADGVIGWCRLAQHGDAGGSSSSAQRADFTVGTSGADINLASTNAVTGTPLELTSFDLTNPLA